MAKLKEIDLCKGEPHVIRENLVSSFGLEKTLFATSLDKESCSYPPVKGYGPLVKTLEDIHDAPIVITNGAKQALAATFYAMHKMGKRSIGFRAPYWSQIPQLASCMGLKPKPVRMDDHPGDYCESYLSVMPCNPDGYVERYADHKYMGAAHHSMHIPFIHDAAYYTPVYLPDEYELGPVGDAQIFSVSKMHGLSGLRLGYTAVYDTGIYKHMLEYIEHMTVGVSVPSQEIYCDVLNSIHNSESNNRKFVLKCRDDLYRAKFFMRTVSADVLEIPKDVEHIPGMFLWAKVNDKNAFTKANIKVAWGEDFGQPGFVRVNLAAPIDDLKEAISRLNHYATGAISSLST